jgi:hypothetical protein
MSGNYASFGNYADAEELATNDGLPEDADAFEAEDAQETRLAGIIINE